MSETKHTPGPWRLSENGYDVEDALGATIADTVFSDFLAEQDTANASLIAAAPDMLQALRDAEMHLGGPLIRLPPDDAGFVLLGTIRAAIAKAEGRT